MVDKDEIERKKSEIKDTMCCPYCDEPLKKWEVPKSLLNPWPNEYFYICFNDECSYFIRGWDAMARLGRTCSHRLMYDPLTDTCQPAPVQTTEALRDGIIDENLHNKDLQNNNIHNNLQMNIKFQTALLLVKDIAVSRRFYEQKLQQKVEYDFGEDVVFHGGFAIHQANHFSKLLFDRPNPFINEKLGKENFELYFETDSLDDIFEELAKAGTSFVHTIKEQPWGQRVFRFYDPDFHIIEIGEPMYAVITRYLKQGISDMEVADRTSMPIEEVIKIKTQLEAI